MRTWTPRVYDLSRVRVSELEYFCAQLPEKRARIAAMRGGVNSSGIDGMPHGHGEIGRPTERTALNVIDSNDYRDVRMIEETAKKAAGGNQEVYEALIDNLSYHTPWEYTKAPIGRRQFYEVRRLFFWLLDKKR